MNKIKYNIIILLAIFLSSCTKTRSENQIIILDKNIDIIQEEVKQVKTNIAKTKGTMKILKKEQPECIGNFNIIENQIEILDLQVSSIDNNINLLKDQTTFTKETLKTEVREYKRKYNLSKIYNYILIILAIFIFVKKINIFSILSMFKKG